MTPSTNGHSVNLTRLQEHLDDESDEWSVLGALLAHPADTFDLLGDNHDPALFTSAAVRPMFECVRALAARGAPLNIVTLTDELRIVGKLAAVGGPAEVSRLATEFEHTPAMAAVGLARMRHKAMIRLLAEDGAWLTEKANEWGIDPVALTAEMDRRFERVRALREQSSASKPMLEFLTPSQLRSFEPPAGWNMVGDYHIQRGSAFVIAGPPGTGKSRALTFLDAAGATGQPFFGMPVHQQFRTMILQCENGRVRLKNELAALDPSLDDFIRYSPPPPYGFAFTDPLFLQQLRKAIDQFRPDVFCLDPWNRLARDDRGKDYKEAFDAILSVLPTGDECPAVGVIAHTRKPQAGERADGRALLNLLAGSYVLGSVPRSVFVLQPASDDGVDDRCVWTPCKNNDGQIGDRSAWIRQNGLFAPCPDFDWNEFNAAPSEHRNTVTEEHMAEVFNQGKAALSRGEAKDRLEKLTGFTKTPCYNALKPEGRFRGRLTENGGTLRWK